MLSVVSPQQANKTKWGSELWWNSLPNELQCNTKISLSFWLRSFIAKREKRKIWVWLEDNIAPAAHIWLSSQTNRAHLQEEKNSSIDQSVKPFFLPVFSSPSFNKTHSYGTHSSKLINCFKTLIHRLSQKSSKFLVIEDF